MMVPKHKETPHLLQVTKLSIQLIRRAEVWRATSSHYTEVVRLTGNQSNLSSTKLTVALTI